MPILRPLEFRKFVDIADGAVVVGVDHLTGGKDFFDELLKVLAVLCAHKVIGVCQLRFFKKKSGDGRLRRSRLSILRRSRILS